MRRSLLCAASLFGALGLLAGAAGADEPPDKPVPPPPAPPEKPPEIRLEESFRLPQQPGKEVTHIPAVVFTEDGKRLITGTSNGEVIVWDAAKRETISRVTFADSAIAALAADREGAVLVALLENGALKVLETATGKVLGAAEQVAKSVTMVVSPDGKMLAIARGAAIEVRSLPALEVVKTVAEAHGTGAGKGQADGRGGAGVTGLAFAPDGARLASVGSDGLAKVWKLPALEVERSFEEGFPLYAVAFSPDGRRIAYGGQSRVVYEAEIAAAAAAGGAPRVIAKDQPYWITSCGYSPDGKVLAFGDESCDIWLFDVEATKKLFHSKHHVECWLSSVAWAPDNEAFLFGCRPNGLGGGSKPAIYEPNVLAEAGQAADVQAALEMRAELEEAVGKLYADPKNAELQARTRDLLEKKRRLLGIADDQAKAAIEQGERQLAQGQTPLVAVAGGAPAIDFSGSLQTFDGNAPQLEPDGVQLSFANALQEKQAYAGPQLTAEQRKELEAIDKDLLAVHEELKKDPAMQETLAKLEAQTKAHVEALKRRCDEIRGSFCVNQWRLKR